MRQPAAPLSSLQLELLKSFARPSVSEQDLKEIKILLSKYFADKASSEAQRIIVEKGWTPEFIDDMAEQHSRTLTKHK
ncbi:hypothetical protein VB264_23370 [Arcicella aquatica]|uniref:Uncharacterized protein n=1 Tax=Arcicella aquatica TaxID=217141 RepID=A0ABU5QVB7_9BACT|nr:hypothetical protein [Arcicella aquatica]MEA5260759.1 hypothetical protein [Arcicella aquatica]